jgi:glycosyltransferase involved in cell wall biosynthesis
VRRLGALILLLRAGIFLFTHGRRFHVFHVHTVSGLALPAVLIGRLLRKAVILKAVGAWELGGILNPARRRQVVYRIFLAILRRADAWVAVSSRLRRAIEAVGVPSARLVTIPNGVSTTRFVPRFEGQIQGAGASDPPQVVFVGRLVKDKGLPVLLQAWTTVKEQVPGVTLHIVGDGPLEDEVRTLAHHSGLSECVRFHGHQQAVLPFLQTASLFVLPSYIEGLSNTLLEAMAAGLPVVATRVSGSEDVIEEGVTGLLVPPGDPIALAEAMTALLKNPARATAMGRNARQRIERSCGLESVVENYLNLYQRVLQKNGVPLCAASPAS